MAVRRGESEQLAKEKLEVELTCPICLDLYKDPRQLPCLHTYCTTCLRSLLRRAKNGRLTCPKCSTDVPMLGPDQVEIFPKAFKLNRLKDIYQDLVAKAERDGGSVCQEHPSQELALFCETCNLAMCRDCYIKSSEHMEHKKGYIKDLAPQYRAELASELGETVAIADLSHALENTELSLDVVKSRHEELRLKAEERFDALVRALQNEKQKFLVTIDREMTARTENITTLRDTLSKLSRDTFNTISSARALHETADDVEFLTKKHQASKIRDAMSKINRVLITPQQASVDVEVNMLDCETLEATCRSHTHIVRNPTEYHADVTSLAAASIHEEMVVHVHIPCSDEYKLSPKVSCTLTSTRNGAPTGEVSETNVGGGEYCIAVTPQQRGRHQLAIIVDGNPIPGSPFRFKVKPPFTLLPALLSEAITTLPCSKPFGLTCLRDGSTVLVLEEGKQRITILEDGVISGFMAVPSQFLAELTTDKSGNIYVTTGETHQILKLDSTGKLLKSTGSFGSRRSEFNFSNGININTLDELYVCDTGNHRVKVLDTDLNLLRIIHGRGKGQKPFRSPHDIAFDKFNNVYVVESQRIQVISPEGHHMHTIGEGILADAVCISMVSTSAFFVTEYGKGCISVFSTSGEFVRSFGADSFTRPQGITVDADSFVYVTTNRDKLCVF